MLIIQLAQAHFPGVLLTELSVRHAGLLSQTSLKEKLMAKDDFLFTYFSMACTPRSDENL